MANVFGRERSIPIIGRTGQNEKEGLGIPALTEEGKLKIRPGRIRTAQRVDPNKLLTPGLLIGDIGAT